MTIDPPGSLATGGPAGIIGINSCEVGSYRATPSTLPCGCDGLRGFVFRNGFYTAFALPGSIGTGYTGINSRGDVVGTYVESVNSAGGIHGLLRPHGADK